MSENNRDTLRRVAWSEICPWLVIFRTFRVAIGLRILVLGAVAIFLTLTGWSLLGSLFSVDENVSRWMRPGDGRPSQAIDQAVPDRPTLRDVPNRLKADPLAPTAWQALDPYFGSWAQLSQPLLEVGRGGATLPKLACLLLCGLWAVAIWAFFGGAITRVAAVQLACDERVGWTAALRHARSKWLSYFAAPLLPLIGAAVCALLIAGPVWVLLGLPGLMSQMNLGVLLLVLVVVAVVVSLLIALLRLLYRFNVVVPIVGSLLIVLLVLALRFLPFSLGVVLTGLAWPLVLLAGLVMAMLLLGLIFGWPLMWSTISAEGTDSFDALSRSYAYVFGRPLHYLFYAVVAALLGALGWLLVSNFAAAVVWLTYWAAGWGCAGGQIQDIIARDREALGTLGYAGAVLIGFWAVCVKLLAVGFIYGYFWTASTAIYFLLRRDVDATEMDEVFLDEDASEPTYGLPPLKTDEAGAPVVDDDVPEVEPDDVSQPEDETDQGPEAGP